MNEMDNSEVRAHILAEHNEDIQKAMVHGIPQLKSLPEVQSFAIEEEKRTSIKTQEGPTYEEINA